MGNKKNTHPYIFILPVFDPYIQIFDQHFCAFITAFDDSLMVIEESNQNYDIFTILEVFVTIYDEYC